ncbi:MAG TPA: hypothetical protein DDZ51_03600 [Planctomycetaceae bacterium]|nr:hypothetical protein [Planctomycetaceae bacterium]
MRWTGAALATGTVLGKRATIAGTAEENGVANETGSKRSVICVYVRGGMSHVDSFDPKPDSAADQPFQSIQTRIPGVLFSELVPELAARADRFTIIRGMSHTENDHEPGERYFKTGRTDATQETPSLGAIAAFTRGWQVPPAYVAIPKTVPDFGFLGSSCAAFEVGGNAAAMPPADVHEVMRRQELLRRLGSQVGGVGAVSRSIASHREASRRAWAIASDESMRLLNDFSKESESTLAAYGQTNVGRYLIMARRLAEAGSSFVTVELDGWDHHANLAGALKKQLPPLDRAVAGLVDDLNARGLSQRVLVVVTTEFGRDPIMVPSSNGAGRGHWSRAYSNLAFGGNAPGGAVLGRTDKRGGSVVDNPVSPADLWATMAHHVGLKMESPTLLPEGQKLNVVGQRLF